MHACAKQQFRRIREFSETKNQTLSPSDAKKAIKRYTGDFSANWRYMYTLPGTPRRTKTLHLATHVIRGCIGMISMDPGWCAEGHLVDSRPVYLSIVWPYYLHIDLWKQLYLVPGVAFIHTRTWWCIPGHQLVVALLRGRNIWVKIAVLCISRLEAGCAQRNTRFWARNIVARLFF